VGGPCNTLYWHTCELKKHGIEVKVVTTSLGIQHGAVIQNQFINSECGMVYYGRGKTSSFNILRKAAECIKEADVVHLNSLFHGLSVFSFFYTKLRYPRKKIVWSVRGELSPGALRFSSWKKLPVLSIYKKLVKNVVFHATSNQET